jgi:hypothetical protein
MNSAGLAKVELRGRDRVEAAFTLEFADLQTGPVAKAHGSLGAEGKVKSTFTARPWKTSSAPCQSRMSSRGIVICVFVKESGDEVHSPEIFELVCLPEGKIRPT